MIKIAADTRTNPQQSGIGMALRTGCGAAGAMVTGAVGGGGCCAARGAGAPPAGGAGNGFCDTGGLGIGTLPGFGTNGADVGGGSEVGGRDGRLIRTMSSSSGATASPRRGGRVIRTVSFFGSLASAMVTLTGGIISLSEISWFVTRQLTLGQLETQATPGGRSHGHPESLVE